MVFDLFTEIVVGLRNGCSWSQRNKQPKHRNLAKTTRFHDPYFRSLYLLYFIVLFA